MKTRILVLALALLASLAALAQESHPNAPKGFDPDKVYDLNELDQIDLFTGGLRATIPLGSRYHVNGQLSYGFTLVYNSAMWDFYPDEEMFWTPPAEPIFVPYMDTLPDHRSNAGLGWRVSLGKIFPRGAYNTASNYWLYESPDGNDREIGNLDTVGAVAYSRDMTYIRAKRVALQLVTLEFPDGAIHTFMRNASDSSDWRLIEIKDRFENKVTITYESDSSWTIRDDHNREHKVYFAPKNYYNAYGNKLVTKVVLAGFNGDTSEYVFNYQDAGFKNSCENDGIDTPENLNRAFLTSLTMPDSSVFQFKYQNSIGSAYTEKCEMGALTSMRLPTGGYVKWDYTLINLPSDDCGPPGSWVRAARSTAGVATRSLLSEALAADGRVTTYTYGKSPGIQHCGSPESEYTTTTVKAADGGRTVHYFSGWPFITTSPAGYRVNERGLPFRRLPDGRKLSREFLGSCTSNCAPLRSTYVNYEWEKGPVLPDTRKGLNRRQTYEKVVLHEDGDRHTTKSWGNYDGVGHFRVLMTTSNIGGDEARFETTLWDSAAGEMKVAADGTITTDVTRPGTWDPWVLNTYYWRSITENETERVSEYCFDKTTGFLTRARLKAGDGTNDVISVFSHSLPSPFDQDQNGKGNVLREEYYGGDSQEVASGALICDTNLPSTPKYTIYNQYQYGGRSTMQYKDAPFKSVDLVIDRNTGLIDESRDTAGILTEHSYNKLGRLTEAKTAGRATAKITYDTVARPPVTIAQALDPSTNAVLTDKRFYYDPWGRVMQSRELMDGGWATTNTTYNVMGRNHTTSMPEFRTTGNHEFFTPAAVTATLYDLYGRMTSVTNPDTSKAEYTYEGLRKKTVTQWVATAVGQAETAVTKTEEYDHRGRLLKIVEKSGPTTATSPIGANVSTEYDYDPDGRLLSSRMTASGGVVQHRIFDYDGRGFLKWESHPESGMTAYTYDPRGHMLSKRQSAADSPFDLEIEYDFAERLKKINSRNPETPTAFRPLKEFEFGTANQPAPDNKADWQKGKLVRATRWNYGEEYDDVYRVDNYFDYIDVAGRRHGRKQKITKIDDWWGTEEMMKELTMSVTLNLLDKVDEMIYPMCVECGAPPVNPERKPKHHYSQGRLTRIDNVVGSASNPITYWPNGMRRRLPHQNGMVDTQEVGAMPRPNEISFKTYDRCVSPTFITQPAGGTGATNLSVTLSGTAPFSYEWWAYGDDNTWGIAGTGQSISVNPGVRTTYTVYVANACGYVTSQDAVVVPSGCEAPTTGWIEVVLQPDGSWILRPNPKARPSRTYQWKRLSDNAIVGTSETLAVGTLAATTTYAFTITDSCGSATSNVTIKVGLPMTTTAFSATWIPATGVRLTWPASSGATGYSIERRAGTTWEPLTTVTGTQFDDTAIQTNKSYAYRVMATSSNGSQSGYSNSDVASTFTYAPPAVGTSITASSFSTALDAVNKIRLAAGMPAVTWGNILSPNDPLPNPGVIVTSRHILACRARMTEALQALGAAPKAYTDPDPMLRSIKALHVTEIQDQTK